MIKNKKILIIGASFLLFVLFVVAVKLGWIAQNDYSSYGGQRGVQKPPAIQPLDFEKEIFYLSCHNPSAPMSSFGHRHSSNPHEIPTHSVWLGATMDFVNNRCSDISFEARVFDTFAQEIELVKNPRSHCPSFSYEVPHNGYYTLFLKTQKQICDTNYFKVAKLEHLQGRHGSSDKYTQKKSLPYYDSQAKIDLIRHRSEDESSFYHRHYMGDLIRFQAFFDQEPLADAKVKVLMQSGWSKEFSTDAEGFFEFHIIRDYFPQWQEFQKRYRQNLLVVLSHQEDDTLYELSYPMHFYPNESEYKSYAISLFITLILSIIIIAVIYLFRKNRTKPFREVKFDE